MMMITMIIMIVIVMLVAMMIIMMIAIAIMIIITIIFERRESRCLTVSSLSRKLSPTLQVTLTLPGVTRSAESKTSWLHFLGHF